MTRRQEVSKREADRIALMVLQLVRAIHEEVKPPRRDPIRLSSDDPVVIQTGGPS